MRFKTLFLLMSLNLVGCMKQSHHIMTVTEVVVTNGGSSFLGNDGGVWNFVATDGHKEFRNWRHQITKVGDKICVFESEMKLTDDDFMLEKQMSECHPGDQNEY